MGEIVSKMNQKFKGVSGAKLGLLFIVGGNGFEYGLRLVSNLIMTRLLYPEAFGLMLIVNTVLTGVQLMSDIGIRGAIILNSRESVDETRYLSVAWTVGVLRGGWITMFVLLLSHPLSQFYGQPELLGLFVVVSVTPMIASFMSPKMMTSERDIDFTRVVLIRAISQVIAFVVVIGWLLITPTLYALAAHGVVISLVVTILSYKMLDKWTIKFSWDKEVVKGIWNYGKWITLSTMLTFFSMQGSKLLMGKMLTSEVLGLYSIAAIYAELVQRIVRPLGAKLLFPLYRNIKNESNSLSKVKSIRTKLALVALPAVLVLAIGGGLIIELLYDDRYSGAKWILQLLASGSIFAVLSITLSPLLLASGKSRDHMLSSLANFVAVIMTMYLGYYFFGGVGLVAGVAFSTIFMYLISMYFGLRNGFYLSMYRDDGIIILAYIALLLLGWEMTGFFEILKTAKLA